MANQYLKAAKEEINGAIENLHVLRKLLDSMKMDFPVIFGKDGEKQIPTVDNAIKELAEVKHQITMINDFIMEEIENG